MGGIVWDFYYIIIRNLIQIYTWVVIIGVIFSWLVSFNVVNMQNQFVAMVVRITHQLTEPALGPIRRFLPSFGGLDFSPIVLLLGLMFINSALYRLFLPFAG